MLKLRRGSRAAGLGALLALGCGGQNASLNQTSVSCPAGRTLLDGTCVSEAVADYVACVRAQGAQLGAERGQKISAEAGTFGVRAGGAAEVRDSLERKYSVSDAATLEIIRSCSGRVGPVASAATPAAPPPAPAPREWQPAALGKYTFEETAAQLEKLGTLVARTDFAPGSPTLFPTLDDGNIRAAIEGERFVLQVRNVGTDRAMFLDPSPGGDFILHTKVNVSEASAGAAALFIWGRENLWFDLYLAADGRVASDLRDTTLKTNKPFPRSGVVSFKPRRDQLVDVMHRNGRVTVWIDGVKALADLEAPFQPQQLAMGTTQPGTTAYDDVIVVRLR